MKIHARTRFSVRFPPRRFARAADKGDTGKRGHLMKIVVAGAGVGGLRAAKLLAEGGADVTVLEKAASAEDMRYNWHDDVSPEVFEECGLPLPEGSFPKKDWTFIAPDGKARGMHESAPDMSVMRGKLNKLMVDEAEQAGAKVLFGIKVSCAMTESGRVTGVIAGGRAFYADLVLDSLGANSPVKDSMPASVRVTNHNADEVFDVYRAFYKKNPSAPPAEYSNKVYMKHLGEPGISWAIQDGEEVDVLIGRVGEMSEAALRNALKRLKEENPSIGDEIVAGGGRYTIPVRYPAPRMVADGYALIGDSAYMTIPMLGSGIASSLRAAGMLADCILNAVRAGVNDRRASSTENLWNYEKAFFRAYADHCGVDVIKRGVLGLKDKTLSMILTSKVLDIKQICDLAKGRLLRPSFKELLRMAGAAGIRLFSLIPMAIIMLRAQKTAKLAAKIPEKYDAYAVEKWVNKLENKF